jgi:hypothetical protein
MNLPSPTQIAFLLFVLCSQQSHAFSPIQPLTSIRKSSSTSSNISRTIQLPVLSVDQNEAILSPNEDNNNPSPESASLLPGQILTIRVGDTSLARKAWKKRRRSFSPILVPCTITSINRNLMVKNNIINILHRFGKTNTNTNNGVVLTVGAMVKLYKHRLGGNLLQHCKALGYDTIVAYLKDVFDEKEVKESGVSLIRIGEKNELALVSSLSMRLARDTAYKAEFVQFVVEEDDSGGNMIHSGTTFQISNDKEKYQTIASLSSSTIQPLSAALRIAHDDEISNRVTTGLECNAFVHSYEIEGDNGSPLLICSIDPPREQIRDQMKRRAYVRRQMSNSNIQLTLGGFGKNYDLKDLKTGDGPFQATVVRVSKRAGAAFVDLGVSRQKGKKYGGGKARVLGMLRFHDDNNKNDHDEKSSSFEQISSSECSGEEAALIEDSIRRGFEAELEDENEGENEIVIEEDVSDMYTIDDNGSVSFVDPLTQESKTIGSINDEDSEEYDDDDDDDDLFAGMSPEERLTAIGNMIADEENQTPVQTGDENGSDKKSLEVGDEVDVYVQAVFPQSGRFMVTTNSNVKKMKELKQEREAEKRLERLASKLGGESGLALIQSFVGKEIEGEIKAISKAGDWCYVQPLLETGLPVGIGACDFELDEPLKSGDRVMISIGGIDYQRGQMSLKVMSKL